MTRISLLLLLTLLQACSTVKLSAHRGAMAYAPGNSSTALLRAAVLGAEYIEVDIRESADGKFFLFHDSEISPGNTCRPQKTGAFSTFSAAEIKTLRHPDCRSEILPFATGLDIIKESKAMVQLDIKEPILSALPDICDELPLPRKRVIVQVYNAADEKLARTLCPGVRILWRVKHGTELDQAIRARPFILQVDEELLPTLIRKERILVKAVADDRPETWRRLYDSGANIIMSDRAEDFIRWRKEDLP